MLERLQKIISRAGIASRRHAEELIRSGQVRVNGVTVTELGAKADPEHDRIEAAGKVARIAAQRAYILLHKPPHVVSTLADPEGRPTVRNFLVGVSERVFPVGRLDYATSGLVFLTDDGELAARMLKAAPALPQTYWVKVKGRVSEEQLRILARALRGKIHPLRATHAAGKTPANPWYEVELTGARRDLLRRNLFAIGHAAEKLKRIKLASLDLGSVEEGHYRRLEPSEVAKLVRAVDRALTQERPATLPVPLPARPAQWSPKWPRKRPQGQAHGRRSVTSTERPGARPSGRPTGRPPARPATPPKPHSTHAPASQRPQNRKRPPAGRPTGKPSWKQTGKPPGKRGGKPDWTRRFDRK